MSRRSPWYRVPHPLQALISSSKWRTNNSRELGLRLSSKCWRFSSSSNKCFLKTESAQLRHSFMRNRCRHINSNRCKISQRAPGSLPRGTLQGVSQALTPLTSFRRQGLQAPCKPSSTLALKAWSKLNWTAWSKRYGSKGVQCRLTRCQIRPKWIPCSSITSIWKALLLP